ncbi:LacI family DNA-binding transcriptional regulator [uncultured Limosilactobacillus sp.]|uniref:LacI family DNA-binding transcriptional regulator n=1 Tax=uncultured Limosilactobacillus sp. TaxID=2837629 RepID=UPI0025D99FED|nr:LacI family DNA-binding transcriptional regulator [uncultured Limosilactobacillus sp.]
MVTIRTIAAKAGVSTSTASRALNDNPRISLQTRQRVKQIARELGYRPNFSARNLSRGEANIIGVVFPIPDIQTTQPANPFHIEIMWGIGKAIRRQNYEMMVAMGTNQEDLVRQVDAMAQQAKVHKFVLLYSKQNDPIVSYLQRQHLTYVIVGHPYNATDRFVDNDNVAVGKAATERLCHLHQLQHPAFIRSAANHPFEADRQSGYEQAMHERAAQSTVVELQVQDDLMAWLAAHSKVDGLIFADDVIYLRYARQLKETELPVACFNNSQWIKVVFNDQAVIDLQPQKLGAEAVKLLFNPRQQCVYVPYQFN